MKEKNISKFASWETFEGATTLGIMTFSLMRQSMMELIVIINNNDSAMTLNIIT
jgi:hypothetical protein